MKKLLIKLSTMITLAISLLLSPFVSANAPATFTAGKEYQILPSAQWLPAPKDGEEKTVKVIEFFSYGCPACFSISKQVHEWADKLPKNVEFSRVPVTYMTGWETLAKGYYAADALGIVNKIDLPLFDAIHNKKRSLTEEASLKTFFQEQGVNGPDFDKAYNSFSVNQQLLHGTALIKEYEIHGVPSFVVNGKYRTDLKTAASGDKLIAILNYLITLDNTPTK